MARWLALLPVFAAFGWAVFYYRLVFALGAALDWKYTLADWGLALVVGSGPLALAVAIATLAWRYPRRAPNSN